MIAKTLQRNKQVEEFLSKTHVKNPVWGYLWYVCGLLLTATIPAYVAWGVLDLRLQTLPMIAMAMILYISICFNRYHSVEHRSHQALGSSIFYMTMGYAFIIVALATFRLYYSRSFLATAYGLNVTWIFFGMVFFRKRHQKYLIIKGGLADRLRVLKKIGWQFVDDHRSVKNKQAYDGVVIDLYAHSDNNKIISALGNLSLNGTPVIPAVSIMEKYFGRANLDYVSQQDFFSFSKIKFYRYLKVIWEVGLIIIFSPLILLLMAVTAIAIKLESAGPVLFTQQRVGRNGEVFTLYKFRSMNVNAEREGAKFADTEDDRVTRVGQIIRKFRIDELPQFWNVIKGDMSLIGPRPEQEQFVEFFKEEIPFYSYRHKVRPGITGWAQVKDGYASNLAATSKKLEYDLYYVKNLSLSLDLLIVYSTVQTIITGFGSR